MAEKRKHRYAKQAKVSKTAKGRNARKAERRSSDSRAEWQGMSPGEIQREKRRLGIVR